MKRGWLGVVCLVVARLSAAETVLQTATSNPGGTVGVTVASSQFLAARLHLDQPTIITGVGGNIFGGAANPKLFAALVAVAGPTSFPAGSPFNPTEVLWSTTFSAPNPSADLLIPAFVALNSGDYLLVFGSGRLGATGAGGMPNAGQSNVGTPQFAFWNGSWFSGGFANVRFTAFGEPGNGTQFLVNSIDTRASQESLDTLAASVASLKTDVDAVGSTVDTRASQATVDLIAGGVAAANAVLATKASQTSVDAVDGHVAALGATVATETSVAALDQSVDTVAASVGALATHEQVADAAAALTTAIGTRAADSSIAALSAKLDAQGSGATRIAIERALADGVHVASLMLPQSAGGQLDAVRQIVDDTIASAQTAGLATAKARADVAKGDAALAAGDFRTAFDWYVAAYQRLLK